MRLRIQIPNPYKIAFNSFTVLVRISSSVALQSSSRRWSVDYIYGDILNKSVLPVIIRADYNRDPEESELHHPYSHITLGGYKNCRIPVDRPISPMKFVKFIMEHFYYVPSSQLEFNFEIEGIVAFEEHIAEKDINKSRIIV